MSRINESNHCVVSQIHIHIPDTDTYTDTETKTDTDADTDTGTDTDAEIDLGTQPSKLGSRKRSWNRIPEARIWSALRGPQNSLKNLAAKNH